MPRRSAASRGRALSCSDSAWQLAAALGLVVGLAFAAPARAQQADTLRSAPVAPPADTARTEPGSRIQVVGGVSVAAPDSAPKRRPWHEQPRFVMARSLVIPGWGQVHNRAWLKAALVVGAEGWLGVRIVQEQRKLDDLLLQIEQASGERETALVNEYNALLEQRLGRQWLFGAALTYALIDAYVDAHFRGFDLEFKSDPALPPGTSPASPADRGGRLGLRVALRRTF